MVEVRVKRIIFDRSSGKSLLILEDTTHQILPVAIGLLEAQLIILALRKTSFSPSLFYQFIPELFAELSFQPLRVEIITQQKNDYYTQFVLQARDKIRYIKCRLSDGILLALGCEIPILVPADLLKSSSTTLFRTKKKQRSVPTFPLTEEEANRLKMEIESLNPEEFWQRIRG